MLEGLRRRGVLAGKRALEARYRAWLKADAKRTTRWGQALTAQGQTLESYRESLRSEILRYKLLGREVQARRKDKSTPMMISTLLRVRS